MTDGLKDEHREAIIAQLAANQRVERAVLFGSRATGTNTATSDVDIALFGDRLTLTDQARLAAALYEIPMAQAVDLVLYDSIRDRELRQHIRNQGVDWFARSASSSGSPENWPVHRFRELLEGPVRNGVYKRKEHRGRGVKIVNMGELFAHPRLRSVPMRRVDLSESEMDRFSVEQGDLLFARRSLVAEGAGKCCVVLDVDEPTTFESSIIRARPDSKRSDSLYLYYFFSSPSGLHLLDTIRRQVAVAGITGRDLSELTVPVPPVGHQRAIAGCLGALDDRIELNRRMTATLEAMARALFKSWFVDFDPVRAKMERRATGLPQDIADLFPSQLVDSEMGEIPETWSVGSLGDIATLRRSGVDPASVARDTPCIGLQHMPRQSIALSHWSEAGGISSRKSAFRAGDILFGKLRPYFHKVGLAPVDGICSTDIVVLKERKPGWSAFVLACVSSSAFVEHTSQTSTGTKMPRTNWQAMSSYELCTPRDAVARKFRDITSPWLERIVGNVHEALALAALRDSLLPKLISGEICVGNAEMDVEAVE